MKLILVILLLLLVREVMILHNLFDLHIDGYIGLVLSAIIFISGINLIRETIDPLLGQPPSKELVKDILTHTTELKKCLDMLDNVMKDIAETNHETSYRCIRYRDEVLVIMEKCRFHADKLELLVDDKEWPLPRYQEIFWIH